MNLSARRLGEKKYLTAQEMNYILKKQGFIDGNPGDYYPTEKGRKYCVEKSWDNGYGGYAYRGYSYNTYDESILDDIDFSEEIIEEARKEVALHRKIKSSASSNKLIGEIPLNNNSSIEKSNNSFYERKSCSSNASKSLAILFTEALLITGITITVSKVKKWYKKKRMQN